MEIAGKLGARILDRNWIGYADQKNWAADQAKHDWILSIDADEAVSEMLEAEIWQLKKMARARTPTPCRGGRNIWAVGFCIPAGIQTGKYGYTTAAARSGKVSLSTRDLP